MDEKHFEKQFKGLKEDKATAHNNVAPKELILTRGAIKPGMKSVIRKSVMVKKYPTDYKAAKMLVEQNQTSKLLFMVCHKVRC